MSEATLQRASTGDERAQRAVRVLYVVDDTAPAPRIGWLSSLLKRLNRMQLNAAVVSLASHGDGTERIQGQDVPVVSLESDRSGLVEWSRCILGVRALVRRHRPDVVHLIGPRVRVAGLLGAAVRRETKIVASHVTSGFNRGFAHLCERGATRLVAVPLVVVEDRDRLAAWRARPEGSRAPAAVIGHGIDLSAARSTTLVGEDVLPLGHLVGAHVAPGRSDDLHRLLEAFRIYRRHRPDARLVVLGSPDAMPVAPWSRDLGVDDSITYVSLPFMSASVLRRLAMLWVHGTPTPDQGAILEAMSVGVPVICDATTGLAPSIREIGGALMRDGSWPRQFAEAARELERDPELARCVGAAGRIVADRHAPLWRQAECLRAVYGWLAHGEPIPRNDDGSPIVFIDRGQHKEVAR